MTSPRTPRQWAEGDTIPADVTAVHHHHEPLLDECGTQCAWIRRASDWKGPWGYALEEEAMLRRMGPVTEVIEDVPLSEVLPQAPEPPRVPWPKPFVPASQSVPAVPVSSTGGKETGEAAETATEGLSGDTEWGLSDPTTELTKTIAEAASIPQWRAALAAAFLIDEEGWRPPLPDSEPERPRRCPARVPEGNVVTEGRQCQQYEGHAHDHTWYGDNGTAYSAWQVTS